MTPGSLTFAASEWFWPVLIFFAAGLFFIWRSYAGTNLSGAARFVSFSLKALGLALLLLILLEPTWTTTRPREGANLFAVVADNSMRMQLRDSGESKTRGEIVRDALTSNNGSWQTRLEETYVVRRYLYDSRLESARDFAELSFDGRESAMGTALRSVAERFQGQPLAGVLLFTDGNATDLENGFSAIPGLPPVYPVLAGREAPLADLALANISASQTVFEDAPVTISGSLKATGFSGERVIARVEQNGRTVAERTIQLENNREDVPLRFQLKPDQPGVSFYSVSVALADAKDRTNAPAEATLFNNTRVVAVDRGRGPHRILYVGGRPGWEFKFMNRAVAEDSQLQLVSLIRIARREPKFTFRGRVGESSNPLFRGFNQTSEETERYDQPVLIRVNTKDENELKGGFPKTPEELYGFEAIILDDLEAEFFTPDQMLLVQHFVSERGGGLMMLGGADSLEDGKYARTPIGEMLPVYLDHLPQDAAVPPPPGSTAPSYHLELTREGWLQPWIRLRTTEEEERARLASLPGFQVLNKLREVKPGAMVLATVRDESGKKFPAVAVQRFGGGRVAAIMAGDWWRGSLESDQAQSDLGKSWRQMLRWLVADVPKRFELHAESAPGAGSEMTLEVRTRDVKFDPLDNAAVEITIQGPQSNGRTNIVKVTAEAAGKEAGVYRAAYVPRESGGYLASAVISDTAGVKQGEAEAGWTSEPLAKVFASLTPNRALLQEIAKKTGGEMVPLNRLDHFVQSLKKKNAPVVETYSYPLWHTRTVFAAALLCFVAEWGIRRVKGLA